MSTFIDNSLIDALLCYTFVKQNHNSSFRLVRAPLTLHRISFDQQISILY